MSVKDKQTNKKIQVKVLIWNQQFMYLYRFLTVKSVGQWEGAVVVSFSKGADKRLSSWRESVRMEIFYISNVNIFCLEKGCKMYGEIWNIPFWQLQKYIDDI